MDPTALRSQFPVLERLAYLNAGTDGPLPRAAVAAAAELQRQLDDGRTHAHFQRRRELGDELRAAYASLLGCQPLEVALTTCTSEGVAQVVDGLALGPGDEILTSDEEHPGLLGALGAARQLHGVDVRMVALERIHEAVRPATRLIACCHVGWMSGSLAPAELSQLDVPVLLDGAQGVGAVPVDVRALGCVAYAGAGQKWLCGPDGTGMLFLAPAFRERLAVSRRGYANLDDPGAGVSAAPHDDARAFDAPSLGAEALACALAAFQALDAAGWEHVHQRARALAARLAELLAEHGRPPAPRGASTLVSFPSPDPEAERQHLAARGVVLRDIPDRPWLRASVGAWNDEHDLTRLVESLAG